jgi:predicted type IV restriction endonuclease
MTYYQAALRILRSAGRPLTTREITDLAVAEGLIAPTGKTPHASMARVLYLRVRTDPDLVKVVEPGVADARRSSVRWALSQGASAGRPYEALTL